MRNRERSGSTGWFVIAAGVLAGMLVAGCSQLQSNLPDNSPSNNTVSAPPSIPAGLSVGGATSSVLCISWSSTSGASTYEVFRDTSANGSFATKSYDGTATSFADGGLSASTTYYFRVAAVNSDGSSGMSAAVSGTTLASGTGGSGHGGY